ncbi:hypothetical protein ACFX2C_030959 [Malus domestica]
MTNLPDDLQGPVTTESPTLSEKLEGNVTNEDLQATMVVVLRSIEKISLETNGEVCRLCSLTRNLQRKLDLEYYTLENNRTKKMMREARPVKEPVIPLFPVLEEKRNKGKNKEKSGVDQPMLEESDNQSCPTPYYFPWIVGGSVGQK